MKHQLLYKSIAESTSSGSDAVTMSATDPNNNTLTYSISAGNDDGKFAIKSTGAITTARILKPTSYALTITTSDALTTSTSKTINITNVNGTNYFYYVQFQKQKIFLIQQ